MDIDDQAFEVMLKITQIDERPIDYTSLMQCWCGERDYFVMALEWDPSCSTIITRVQITGGYASPRIALDHIRSALNAPHLSKRFGWSKRTPGNRLDIFGYHALCELEYAAYQYRRVSDAEINILRRGHRHSPSISPSVEKEIIAGLNRFIKAKVWKT